MKRVVSLYLPSWPTDRRRKAQGIGAPPAETPLVVTGRIGSRKVVVDADAAARAQGAHPGLPSAQAQARVPGLLTVEHDPASDASALERIALWALRRYSPLVAVDGCNGLWIDATGVAHLFGGEAALLGDLVGRLGRGGAHARAAVADSPGAACALARFGASRTVVSARGAAGRAGAEWEVFGSAAWCRAIAQQSLKVQRIEEQGRSVETRRVPIGVVGAITPWNFPLLLAIWKIAPALVTGNTMVLKPSPSTPLCTLKLGELLRDVLPPGVLNIVSGGNDLGAWLVEHPDVGKISFTGSTATGRKIMSGASGNLKRITLELGGNDPAIVMADNDPAALAKELFWAAFANSAQFCVATKRLYIHEDIYDRVRDELVAYAKTVKVGDGAQQGVDLGPIQNRMQFDKVKALLEDTRRIGADIVLGGEALDGPGYFIPVTIVDNPPDDSRVVTEEAFGPVLPLLRFNDVDEVVRRANHTDYGLAASVWSRDVVEARQVAERLESGTVWINEAHVFGPHIAFGGHKQSGMGVENALEGLTEYTNPQTITTKTPPP